MDAERFEEGLDPEYHDATENPQDIERPDPARMPCFSHAGFGSSSLGPEQVADELRRLTEAHAQMTGSTSFQDSRGGATLPQLQMQFGIHVAQMQPERVRRNRGRAVSPDPLMFRSTFGLEHDQEASARAREEPIEQLRDRVCTTEHNLETLRTRLTQVADLRDAQGIREDHRALVPI